MHRIIIVSHNHGMYTDRHLQPIFRFIQKQQVLNVEYHDANYFGCRLQDGYFLIAKADCHIL